MHDYLDDLYEICETLTNHLSETNDKIRKAGGQMNGSDVEYVDKLTHAIKSVKTTIAMIEAGEDGYSSAGGSYRGNYERGGRGYSRNDMRGGSYARGRNARRDSRGRYSSDDEEEFTEKLRDLMDIAPSESQKNEIRRLLDKMER